MAVATRKVSAALVPQLAARTAGRRLGKDFRVGAAALAVVALPLPYLLRFDASHVVTATVLGVLLIGVALYSRRAGVVAALLYLLFLGDYRRYVGYFEGFPQNDPLLLVAPAAATLLFCAALFENRLSLGSTLAKLVAALMALMLLGMFNPLQGGLQVGFAGALFYLVPLLWFWIGRAYATSEFMERFGTRVLLGVGTIATVWGLYQTYFGLLAFEQLWVDRIGYGALYISDEVIRAIGFFNSSAEYQRFLLVTATTLLAAWFARRSKVVLLLPVVLVALFLAAARGPVVMFVGAAVVLWAVSARSSLAWTPRFVIAAAGMGVALAGVLLFLQDAQLGGRVGALVDRQVTGLLDPANEKTSTATGHLQMMADGIVAGITSPAGQGLGITTLAATKFGSETINAEMDFANIMLSLGVLGGLLYVAIMIAVLSVALRWWKAQRHIVALTALGIVVVTFGSWLIGGEYSMAALVWFYIGAMDRLAAVDRQKQRSARRARRPHYA